MIAVLWSELAGWGSRYSRQTLCAAVCGSATIGALTMLRPEACLEGLTGVIIWVGFLAGRQVWSPVAAWEWISRTGIAPGLVVTARVAAACLVCLAHLLAVLPFLVFMALVWGVPVAVFLEAGLILLTGAVVACTLGLLGPHLGLGEDAFFGNVLVSGWLILTAMIPWLRGVNPFYLVWRAIEAPDPRRLLPGAGLAVFLIWLAAFILRREVRRE